MLDDGPTPKNRDHVESDRVLDHILCAQFAVAWAGESGEEARLGWWRTDLVSEFGGEDLFERLLPNTWQWATLQGAREAARRRESSLASQEPGELVSLFHLGFVLDQRLEERLQKLKHSGQKPTEVLPGLAEVVRPEWVRDDFAQWIDSHPNVEVETCTVGRCLGTHLPADEGEAVEQLIGALSPVGEDYPFPYFRRGP